MTNKSAPSRIHTGIGGHRFTGWGNITCPVELRVAAAGGGAALAACTIRFDGAVLSRGRSSQASRGRVYH